MMRIKRFATIAVLLLFVLTPTAQAYIGPGAGVSAIGSFIALIAAVLAALFGFLWYPIKRLFRKRETRVDEEETAEQ